MHEKPNTPSTQAKEKRQLSKEQFELVLPVIHTTPAASNNTEPGACTQQLPSTTNQDTTSSKTLQTTNKQPTSEFTDPFTMLRHPDVQNLYANLKEIIRTAKTNSNTGERLATLFELCNK
ncbi:hypothetical protein NPIL_59801 [Nephila pilipes]|uniref:Uncharacterized protein n=1 Tax=Nephila pilipes TaxID=299642 RepID=A0A8X6P5D8_NEPPI|nr:hypothetical protein NPIL_59801 [Nephila pilipes]